MLGFEMAPTHLIFKSGKNIEKDHHETKENRSSKNNCERSRATNKDDDLSKSSKHAAPRNYFLKNVGA